MVLRTFLRTAIDSSASQVQDAGNIQLVHECIESAIRSTIAFDRVGAPEGSEYRPYKSQRVGRLILTNIFGTLHA